VLRALVLIALAGNGCSAKLDAEKAVGASEFPAASSNEGANDGAPLAQQVYETYGSCEVTFTGDEQRSFRHSGGMGSLGSDYFMNQEELEQVLRQRNPEPAKLAEALRKDPRLTVLVVNYGGDGMDLNIGVGAETTYADLPFAPGKYRVGEGRGEIVIQGSLDRYARRFRGQPGGSFEILTFDGAGLHARFEAKLVGDVSGEVTGTVRYRCAHNTAVCLAARGR
jgi:hypothetical protein